MVRAVYCAYDPTDRLGRGDVPFISINVLRQVIHGSQSNDSCSGDERSSSWNHLLDYALRTPAYCREKCNILVFVMMQAH